MSFLEEKFSLRGKVVVVTGALGLLGKIHCRALSEAGANVIAADINKIEIENFVEELATESIGVELDVTKPEPIKDLVSRAINKYGKIDVLINNAAINDMFENPKAQLEESRFENYPLKLWQKSVDVNLTGIFLCSQIIGSQMISRGGSIINVASTYGIVAPNQSLYQDKDGNQKFFKPPGYSATKGGVIAFTKYLAAYWGDKNIRVNALSPGGVKNAQDEYFIESYSVKTPLKRMAEPTDYIGAVIFLASDASSYMTGANLIVDGGWTAW
ncbi:MAG: SDR family oxidoreductase [Melioribacteraceae bacterium]|nr:SDR family oxidoreductase [Melioribacteraceae bacterium]MCF8356458.1 SDR family oxidoreductase [Melioribacteraceae bacterium]MCF8395846.1 SDR family oxidoreductase [Melioribacteraceae bacterium]MCF8420930.1 SDR family oxidoreductase [Melioribacteraceae bacterium]